MGHIKLSLASLIIFWTCLVLTSCEKEVTNIKIPQSPPKLAIAAFISPQDTIIRVSVVKSIPVLGKGSLSTENIKDAVVVVSDESNSVTLLFNENERIYTIDAKEFPILPGKTYFLSVNNSEGLQATASCTIPLSYTNTLEMIVDSVDNEYGGKLYSMQLLWKDIPAEVNYYRFAAEVKVEYQTVSGEVYSTSNLGYLIAIANLLVTIGWMELLLLLPVLYGVLISVITKYFVCNCLWKFTQYRRALLPLSSVNP
jgi:hypothetical protein